MSRFSFFLLASFSLIFWNSCEKDPASPSIDEPTTYTFERDGQSTVDFSGQTTRIRMAQELTGELKNFDITATQLLEMYANQTANGGDADPFTEAALNESTKSIRSKVAASSDYFASNTASAALIKEQLADWLEAQVEEVFPAAQTLASAGQAGQIADGTSVRYVNAQGLEYDQLFAKSLIGALMIDQMLNNYLSTSVLDAGTSQEDNTNGTILEGKAYTNMEHKWDEAYGYLFGNAASPADPLATLGSDDNFLNKYLGRVDGDEDYAGIADNIFQALKRGRAAIVAGEYAERDAQIAILREEVSKIAAIRAIYYLQQGKQLLANNEEGAAFHAISEGYGFIYSLQFTRQPGKSTPYLNETEVADILTDLMDDGANGLWDVEATTLDELSERIATAFGLSVAEAGN